MTDNDPTEPPEDAISFWIARYLSAIESGQAFDRQALLDQAPELVADFDAFVDEHEALEQAFGNPTSASSLSDVEPGPTLDLTRKKRKSITVHEIPNKERFGDYELLDEIDRGGMGVVYRARHVELKRIVALKMIKSGELASGDEVARFFSEAKAAAALEHPHIVPIFDTGLVDGRHFISMAFVEGASLADRLLVGAMPPRDAAVLCEKVARAVSYAHQQGVIHRDLKPGNILIDTDGEPKITDFGLAKNLNYDDKLTTTGQILGTPAYMPPEQARSQDSATPSADVYSIGAILYACLTGEAPYTAGNALDILIKVQESDPTPPHLVDREIPVDLSLMCLKCLEKLPERRYDSALALADDLSRFLKGEPTHGGHVTYLNRMRRWARRKPALAAHLAGLFTVFLLGTLFNLPAPDWGYMFGYCWVLFVWAIACYALQRLAEVERWQILAQNLWGTVDAAAFAWVLTAVDPPRATYLVGYPLLIAASGLFGRTTFVLGVTLQCMFSYIVVSWFLLRDDSSLYPMDPGGEPRLHFAGLYTGALFVFAMIIRAQVKRLRALSEYYESR